MIFIEVEDYSDLFVQYFHYEVLNLSGPHRQERSRLNANMSLEKLLGNHTSKLNSHENPILKRISDNSALLHEYQKTSKGTNENDTQVSRISLSTFFKDGFRSPLNLRR